MRFSFIINPYAGRGKGAAVGAMIRQRFGALGLSPSLHITRNPAEAEALAAREGASADCVVAVGGDGTVHHVGSGLIRSGSRAALGILPIGSGNDYARTLSMPRKLRPALEALINGRTTPLDYGRVRWHDGVAWHETVFLNSLGVGMDAAVAREARKLPLVRGIARYAITGVLQLRTWPAPTVEILAEGSSEYIRRRILIFNIGNGATSGGGFRLTPDASPDDGLLDVCLIRHVPFVRALLLLPLVMTGRHLKARPVEMLRTRRIVVRADADLPVHADGEVITNQAREVIATVIPAGLQVRRPP